MFIGHFAVGLAAKRASPKVSLGSLFMACQLLDLIWPLLLLLGLEHAKVEVGNTVVTPLNFYDYPISHSLMMTLIWSVLFGVIYYFIKKDRRGALVVGLLVLSHWLLDLIVHRPDLPVAMSGPYVGFGLWNNKIATLVIESLLFIAGVFIYKRTTRPSDRYGFFVFWILIGLLALIYFANLFGPPPPSIEAVAVAGNLIWVFVAMAFWADRHRAVVRR